MVEGDGKVNGKFPIYDDLLACIWCKMKICPKDTLLGAMKNFYKLGSITASRDMLFERVPAPEGEARRVKHKKAEDILQDIYNIFQAIPAEDPPVFLALDLNNLPCIDVKNIDGCALVCQQNAMKNLMEKMAKEQEDMKRQLTDLKNTMARTNTSTSTSGNQANANVVRAAPTAAS